MRPDGIATCLRLFVATLGFVLGLQVAAAPASSLRKPVGFCKEKMARNYLAPLRQMAPLHHSPESGHLPFASDGVLLNPIDNGLRVGAGSIGFAFSDQVPNRPRRLRWIVEAELARVDKRGKVTAVLAKKTQYLGVVRLDELRRQRFAVSARQAFYRVSLVIRKKDGTRLARYGEYYRVVAPALAVRGAAFLRQSFLENLSISGSKI